MRRWVLLGLVLVVAVVAVVAAYALLFRSSDEEQIKERLDQLAEAARIEDSELSPSIRQSRIREEIPAIFSKEASASVAELEDDLHGRDAIAAAVLQLATVYQSANVSFGGVRVRLDLSGKTAEVTATATVAGAPHGEAFRRDKRRVTFTFGKVDGDWKITAATVAPKGDGPS